MKSRDKRFDEAITKMDYDLGSRSENAKMLLWKINQEPKKDLVLIYGTGYVASRQQLERFVNDAEGEK